MGRKEKFLYSSLAIMVFTFVISLILFSGCGSGPDSPGNSGNIVTISSTSTPAEGLQDLSEYVLASGGYNYNNVNGKISASDATGTVTETPTETPTPSSTPTVTETPTPSSTPTVTETPTPSSTPTATSIPTSTSTPTATSIPTSTSTPTPTSIPTATSTCTSTPKPGVGEFYMYFTLKDAVLYNVNNMKVDAIIIKSADGFPVAHVNTITPGMGLDGWIIDNSATDVVKIKNSTGSNLIAGTAKPYDITIKFNNDLSSYFAAPLKPEIKVYLVSNNIELGYIVLKGN